ncbi:nucleotide sugar dehydrogenase [Zhongshania aquimaris]|uniref:Nucleotide sugar dehydrogenase n=1 Tax=Zhongshania aquimaris TaxID=2857107 RepID=A0ABS6VPE3_9GAMM|nr:nucleotide sugar dehydrogenase [Zhongshania aquimaris]MBW2940185.1 nucleotide sugar dehydrogenase [Zhongshania aquimaris]
MSSASLLQRINNKETVIGVFGLGYVGLPLALCFAEANYKVIGFDTDPAKPKQLSQGQTYLKHINAERIQTAIKGNFSATCDYAKASQLDAIIICVPTPLNKYREPDLSYVTNTVSQLLPHLKAQQILSLESTSYPGTTEELVRPLIESKGFTIGEDYFLVYSPEREDPGNSSYTTKTIPKVCGGETPACLNAGVKLYESIIDTVVPVSSTKAAEMTKLLENIYRAVNIGLVNEMKIVADKMGINIHEVIDAAATKPFGFTKFTPGPGLGGHCIPIDPFYLTWKAREYGIHTRFIELAGDVNRAMPEWVVQKTTDALNEHGKAVKGSRILILGLAYKKNVSDSREAPAFEIIAKLKTKGANVDYSDPHIPLFPKKRDYIFNMQSIELTPGNLQQYDCAILVTDHDSFDCSIIARNSKLVIDTRNRLAHDAHIISA